MSCPHPTPTPTPPSLLLLLKVKLLEAAGEGGMLGAMADMFIEGGEEYVFDRLLIGVNRLF